MTELRLHVLFSARRATLTGPLTSSLQAINSETVGGVGGGDTPSRLSPSQLREEIGGDFKTSDVCRKEEGKSGRETSNREGSGKLVWEGASV